MRSHIPTPTSILHHTTATPHVPAPTPTTSNSAIEINKEINDTFLTIQDEKDLAAGILCVSSGGKGKSKKVSHCISSPTPIVVPTNPKSSVSFSPHLRTHPYNPTLRVSTSLKPLASQQQQYHHHHHHHHHLSPSPNNYRSFNQSLLDRDQFPQTITTGTPPHSNTTITTSSSSPSSSSSSVLNNRYHPKSILKYKPDYRIRIAKSVEVGTRRNCEDAKMSLGGGGGGGGGGEVVGGVGERGGGIRLEGHDGGITEDGDGDGDGEGEGRGREREHGDENENHGIQETNMNEKEESSVDSLFDVIIGQSTMNQDAFDLVSIGEAYDTVLVKMRFIFQSKPMEVEGDGDDGDDEEEEEEEETAENIEGETNEWKRVIKSIKIRVDGLLKAFKRDVGSLVGMEIPTPRPINDGSSSPSAPSNHIQPPLNLPDTPSPQSSPNNIFDSPTNPRRKGYTAAEIQYRRAQANVGQECLKFLAFVFYRKEIFSCFTQADLLVLLESVLLIPITLKLHTPNPKKSYALAVYALTHLKLPIGSVLPVKDKILRALSSAVGEIATKHWGGGPGKKEGEGGNVRARVEGFSVIQQVLIEYPEVFGLEHRVLLPLILKGLCNPVANVRIKALGSLGALIRGRMTWTDKVTKELKGLMETDLNDDEREEAEKRKDTLRVDLMRIRTGTKDCEVLATRLLFEKQTFRIAGSPVPPAARRLWDRISRFMAESMKTSPHWSCSTWASLVTLMGDGGYMQQENCKAINLTVLQLVLDFKTNPSAVHPQFCRMAWDHAIHAAIRQNSTFNLDAPLPVIKYQPQSWLRHPASEVIYVTIIAAKRLLENGDKLGRPAWNEASQAADLATLRNCLASLDSVLYGLTGAIHCSVLPKTVLASEHVNLALAKDEAHSALFDKLFQDTLGPLLVSMLSAKTLDEVRNKAYDVLGAITAPFPKGTLESWNLDHLLHPAFFGLMPSGEFPSGTREESLAELASMHSARHVAATSALPGWGAHWIATAFVGQLLPTFERAMQGAHQMREGNMSVDWVKSEHGLPLIPAKLSGIWRNMVAALASADAAVLQGGVSAITRLLRNIVTHEGPYFASSPIDRSSQEILSLRMSLMAHLLDIAMSEIGESVFAGATQALPIIPAPNHRNAASPSRNTTLGNAVLGHTTPANFILDRLQSSYEANIQPTDVAIFQHVNLCKRLVMLNLCEHGPSRFANFMESLPGWQDKTFALDLWLLIGDELTTLKPFARTSDELIICAQAVTTYLAMPFLNFSAWSTSTSYNAERMKTNLKNVFQALLTDVYQEHTPDIVILESLASRLMVHAEKSESKESKPLMCDFLVSAIDVTFWKSDHIPTSVAAEAQVNWLDLVNHLLCDGDVCDSQQQGEPAVLRLLEQCVKIAEQTENDHLPTLLARLQEGLVHLLMPSDGDWYAEQLDDVYIRLLIRISDAMKSGHIPVNSESLARYSDIFALRVVSSHEERVIAAFQSFWNSTFAKVDDLAYSVDLKVFLRSFMEADSQFLVVPGLEPASQPESSSVDSVAYYADVSHEVQDDMLVDPTILDTSNDGRANSQEVSIEALQPDVVIVTPSATTEHTAIGTHTPNDTPTSPSKRLSEEPQSSVKKRRISSERSDVLELESEDDIVPNSQPSTLSASPNKSQHSLRKGASGTLLGAVGAAMGRIIPGLVWRSPSDEGFMERLPEESSLAGSYHGDSPSIRKQSSQKRKAVSTMVEADDISTDRSSQMSQADDIRPPTTPMKRQDGVSVVIPVRPKRRKIGKDVNKSITSMASVESEISSVASGTSREATPSGDCEPNRDVELPRSKKSSRVRKRRGTSSNSSTVGANKGLLLETVRREQDVALPQVEAGEASFAAGQQTILCQENTTTVEADPVSDRREMHDKILALVAEAASLSEGTEGMDILGITNLLDDLEKIRGSAMRDLRKHALGR